MENAEQITVEVAYSLPDEQMILRLDVPAGSSLMQAVEMSGILERFPEIDRDKMKTGVFGKLRKRDQVLQAGDRVEIYRPLIADPKQVRKERAAAGKRMKKGGGSIDTDANG